MIAVNLTFLPSINPPPYMAYAKVIIEEGIKVVETAGSAAAGELCSTFIKVLVGFNTLPTAPCIAEFKEAGIYVIHKCTTGKFSATSIAFLTDIPGSTARTSCSKEDGRRVRMTSLPVEKSVC